MSHSPPSLLSVGCEKFSLNLPVGMNLIGSIIGLSILTVTILFGNILVILSVILCRKLRQNVTSYLILSLAVADVSVGALILPFSTANSVLGVWIFGQTWCQIWLMLDVFMCTASIYNLVAISVDRFFAIVRPMSYANVVTPRKVGLMIIAVWIVSFLICIPPMIPWSNERGISTKGEFVNLSTNDCGCTPLHNSPAYVIFSAFGSFYVPMAVIIVIYVRIFQSARKVSKSMAKGYMSVGSNKRTRRNATVAIANDSDTLVQNSTISSPTWKSHFSLASRRQSAANTITQSPTTSPDLFSEVLRIHKGKYEKRDSDPISFSNREFAQMKKQLEPRCSESTIYRNKKLPTKSMVKIQCELVAKNTIPTTDLTTNGRNSLVEEIKSAPIGASLLLFGGLTPTSAVVNRKISGSSVLGRMLGRRTTFFNRKLTIEIRAAKTVAIVTGCFILCWLGFAIVYLLSAFPFCPNSSCVPEGLSSFLFWMGYVNSGLNVIIYALFSKPFRDAFRRILCLRKDF